MTRCLAWALLLGASSLGDHRELGSTAVGRLQCSPPFEEVGGRCLFIDHTTTGTWPEMREICQTLGGDLIKLDSVVVHSGIVNFIKDHGLPARNYWVGATDNGHEGVWVWVDGSPVQMGTPLWGYSCSGNHFPDDAAGNQNCAFMSKSHHMYLNDYLCNYGGFASPICEV